MNRVFICGDTHGSQNYDARKISSSKWTESKELDKDDYLIIAGDFGFVWSMFEPSEEEKWWYNWFAEKPYTTLFIDGNHENFDRLDKLPTEEKFGGEVGVLVPGSVYHLKRGEVYVIADMKFFTFGGGTSIDKAHRIPFVSWWERENPSHREYNHGLVNLNENNWEVDYVITHDCPTSTYYQMEYEKYENVSQLQKFLEDVKSNLSYKRWFFGHYHDDNSFDDKLTVLYNEVKEVFKNGDVKTSYP